jgi:putative holliday junction resolvase
LTDSSQPSIHGRILALDVGKKRIGLAVSDPLGLTAQGIDTLQRTRMREDLQRLAEITSHWNVQTLLVGRPLHMRGTESRQSDYTEEFAERLRHHLQLPIVFWDERLTSAEAERMLRESGTSVNRKEGTIDRLAAVLLLQSYLGFQQMANLPEKDGALG